jgi:hypothetical protein
MEQSHFWETARNSCGQEISCLLWNNSSLPCSQKPANSSALCNKRTLIYYCMLNLHPLSRSAAPCRLSTTAYSIHSQLSSVPGGLFHAQIYRFSQKLHLQQSIVRRRSFMAYECCKNYLGLSACVTVESDANASKTSPASVWVSYPEDGDRSYLRNVDIRPNAGAAAGCPKKKSYT